MQKIISSAIALREDLNVVLVFHEEDDTNEMAKVGKKVKLIGKMLEDKYNPLATVTVTLFTNVKMDKDGSAEYRFITNRTKVDGCIIPAKSPDGMLDLIMPNDLKIVFEKMHEYYN